LLWSFFIRFLFLLVSSILPLLLSYFSSSSVLCLFNTYSVNSYTSRVTFYTNVPPFRKPFRAFFHYSFIQLRRSMPCIISIAFQSEFPTEYVLVLHVSSANNFSFP
jgi:hypothetical protein